MSEFKDREKSFENKFAHDEKLSFEAEARFCKLFGLWVAEQLGFTGAEADSYAANLVTTNLQEPGLNDVLDAVRKDIDNKGIEISDHLLQVQMAKFLAQAQEQIHNQ